MQKDIGERLREERERVGLSQLALGEVGGVKKLAQLKYEKSERFPDAAYLAKVAKIGLDIQYIVTGIRAVTALPKDELELIEHYRAAPLAVKGAALAALTSSVLHSGVHQSFSGNLSGQFAGQNIINKGQSKKGR